MKTAKQIAGFSQTAIALAVLGAFSPAQAQEFDMTKPTSFISVGVGAATGDSKDRAQFGIYNGLRREDVNALVDFEYRTRDDATGFWTRIDGRNLGLDNREIRASQETQGKWKYFLEYNEITRHSPYTVNTADQGVGTTTPTIVRLATPGTGTDYDLKTERKGYTLAGQAWLMPGLLFEASFKNQDKEGARLWGKGYDCNAAVCGTSTATAIDQTKFVKNALLFIAEPIDSTIKQIEAKFTFHDEKLAATAGYYGTFYENNNGNVKPTVPDSFNNAVGQPFPGYPAVTSAIIAGGGLSLQNVLQLPMALQPDNSAHQFYVDGNYGFTPTTKGTFKFAFTHGTQHRDFGAQGLSGAPQGSTNLDGDVDTTLAQVGFSTQPISKLSVVGSWRYERKEDKTPQFLYNVQPQTAVPAAVPPNVNSFWNNGISSNTHMGGKLDATYRLPWEYRVTVGGEFSSIEREVPPTDPQDELVAGLTAVRKKNTEAGYRLELAKNMSETLTGRIIYAASKRRGSDWTTVSTLDPATPGISAANLALINQFCGGRACYGQSLPAGAILGLSTTAIFPANMTDLDREKVKLLANWSPTDRLALNVYLEDGTDKTAATNDPIAGGKGWRDTDFRFYNVDASFLLSENWKLTGYASRGESSVQVNHSTGYIANIKSTSDAVSLGVIGRISDRIQVGGNVAYYNDVNDYNITAAPSATGAPASATNIAQAAIGLPDITLRKTAVSLFANYGLNRNSDIRVDVIHQRAEFREWVWGNNGVPFTFADNTTVSQQPNQNVTFFAAKYIYKFQ